MGLIDRDYMHDRHRATGGAGATQMRLRKVASGRNSWMLPTVAWSLMLIGLTLAFKFTSNQLRGTKAFPQTGDIIWFTEFRAPRVATLTLRAPAGKENYAVRLDEWSTRAPVVIVPVRAGDTVELMLPLGRYRTTIYSGTAWQGTTQMFGWTGQSREAIEPTELYRQGASTYNVTIDLRSTLKGNMPTKQASD